MKASHHHLKTLLYGENNDTCFPNTFLAHMNRIKRMSVETVYFGVVFKTHPSCQCVAIA